MTKELVYGIKKCAGYITIVCCVLLSACNNNYKGTETDSPTEGVINISVDESYKPIIEEQIKVFESSFPGAKIIAHYKTEADCFKDLLKDSATRMIIATHGLNAKEEDYFKNNLGYVPAWNDLASDAIVVVVNGKSNDTLFTKERLRQQLSGALGKKQTFVFDGLNATSIVRFAVDSILNGARFDSTIVKAVKSSKEVLDYVATDENAIGFVGISWIGNPEDTAQVNMLKKIKMAYIKCDRCPDSPYVKPTQLGILTRRYPLVRGLYYVVKERNAGLGTGFVSFLKNERGQLIFRRAYLGHKMSFAIRDVKINEKL
ncbi:PstS family phosphate ABC transporter substrate-binding protein [Ferruginibacter sp. SUN106]|uniref:PstS family phosphate ABC transporter substrate-binding protein n=1 Tax=Ferruginibacter sp. SUN106 TaxID=2978348 RepID=UPI003D359B8A